jgi:IS4 transposase
MYSISTFQNLLKGIPRSTFDQLVKRHNGDKYCKKFRHWDHLVAMLYVQLSGAKGLRSLEAGFNSHAAYHYHLGTSKIKRSTLADANEKRSDRVFSDTATWLMGQVSRKTRQHTKDLMFLLDSTSLTLKGREFERWTKMNRTQHTQGVKLHLLFDSNVSAPSWQCITPANVNDVEMAPAVPIETDATYVFDKGYTSYNWWHYIDSAGGKFVTRFKRTANIETQHELSVPPEARDVVLSDRVVSFKNKRPGGARINKYHGRPLRCVTIVREGGEPLVFATNDFERSALEIAQVYKARWGIELFFKWVKQHLEIKQFVGRNENAVRIQILTALISYLLVALFRQNTGARQTFWECLSLIRATLFQRPMTEDSLYRRQKENLRILADTQGCLFT